MAAKKKKRAAKKAPASGSAKRALSGITGKVEVVRLDRVKPNPWNPNRMTQFLLDSTREGMRRRGWLASHALLVWGTDEKGVRRDLIIDGEHRWTCARDLEMQTGPMVFLDGVTERDATALTIELNQKRGEPVQDKLAEILRGFGGTHADLGMELGFEPTYLDRLLGPDPGDFLGNQGLGDGGGGTAGDGNETGRNNHATLSFVVTLAQKATVMKAIALFSKERGRELKPSEALIRVCERAITVEKRK